MTHPHPYLILLIPLIIWDVVWRGIALWKAAKNNQSNWFIALLVVNSVGILPIIYLFFFQKNKSKVLKSKRLLIVILLMLIIPALVFGTLIYTFYSIYQGVKKNCENAREEYRENCVDSLMKLIQSDKSTLKQKNSAVWTLGQLADKRVLPLLYELDKSLSKQDKCPLDTCLSKYEVQKAIKWCEKGNVTSWMYRNRENWR